MLKNMEKMTENFCLTVLVLQQCFQKHFQTFSCVSPYGQDKLLDLVSEIWIENPKSRIQEQSVLLNHFWHYILRFCCRFSSVQSLSHVRLFATPWIAARQASLSITNYQSLLKLMSIESVMPSNHLILCRPLLLMPSIFPSIRVFSHESAPCIRWPKYWSFSFNISPSAFLAQFSSVAQSCPLQPHGLQQTRPPCPSPTPRIYWNSCPLNQWCHPTISSILCHSLLLLPPIFLSI